MEKFSTVYNIHEAIKKTRRVGIQHLNKLKPMDFIKLVKMFKEQMGGKVTDTNASISLKVDGFGCRFGLDLSDNFFLESSNSGPQFKDKAFSQFTIGRTGKADKISIAYDDLFNSLKNNKKLQKILKKHNTKTGIKVVAECLYNPIGNKKNGKIKFVAIEYDLSKLGDIATIVLIKVLDGQGDNDLENSDAIINEIKKISDKDFLFTDANTSVNSVDLNVDIDDVLKFVSKYPDLEKKLLSRKHADREVKNLIKDTLLKYQEKMSSKLLKAVGSAKFGDQFEGVVFSLLSGKTFKVIHKDFSNTKKFRPK